MDKPINTIKLSIIQNKLANYLTQSQFLESIFPAILGEADKTNLLYFIFSDSNGSARTRSVFMNGNYKQTGEHYTRCQVKALDFIAKMLENKDTISQWVEFLKTKHPNLKLETIKSIADQDIDNYTERFHDLILHEVNQYYLLLYIICWSVFGEQIDKCNFKPSTTYLTDNTEVLFPSDEKFYEYMFSKKDNIKCIEMAFHGGYKWLYDANRITLLTGYLSSGGKLRVLVNSPSVGEIIAPHMCNPDQCYIGFNGNVDAWKRFALNHHESVELVISDIPLLHSYVNFLTNESKYSRMLVIFYTYGHTSMYRNQHLFLNSDSQQYALFQEEFNYLWEHSKSAD